MPEGSSATPNASSLRQRTRTLDPGQQTQDHAKTSKTSKTGKSSGQTSPLAPIKRSLERLGDGLPNLKPNVEVK